MVDKKQLVRILRVGDTELIGRTMLDIADIALSTEVGLTHHDREELRQELSLYLWRKRPKVRRGRNPFAYLLQTARRRLAKLRVRARAKEGHRMHWHEHRRHELETLQARRPPSLRHEPEAI